MIGKAEAFARKAHMDHRRKGAQDLPYAVHLAKVADFVTRHCGDDIVIPAAWLHDTVEDVGVTFDQLRRLFGEQVADVVRELTDDKRLSKAERKKLQKASAPKEVSARGSCEKCRQDIQLPFLGSYPS